MILLLRDPHIDKSRLTMALAGVWSSTNMVWASGTRQRRSVPLYQIVKKRPDMHLEIQQNSSMYRCRFKLALCVTDRIFFLDWWAEGTEIPASSEEAIFEKVRWGCGDENMNTDSATHPAWRTILGAHRQIVQDLRENIAKASVVSVASVWVNISASFREFHAGLCIVYGRQSLDQYFRVEATVSGFDLTLEIAHDKVRKPPSFRDTLALGRESQTCYMRPLTVRGLSLLRRAPNCR